MNKAYSPKHYISRKLKLKNQSNNKSDSFYSLTSLLNSTLSNILLKNPLVLQRLQESWHLIIEHPFNMSSKPIKLHRNKINPSQQTLVVQCAQQQSLYITMNKERIIEAITQRLSYSHICDITISIIGSKRFKNNN